ncbi:MAG: RtcB family protein [bacterium]
MVSYEHRMLVYKGYKSKGYEKHIMQPMDLASMNREKGYYGFNTVFNYSGIGLSLTNNQIRIDIMIAADGTIRKEKDGISRYELHFHKKRKIDRAKLLLETENINYTIYNQVDGTTCISFTTNNLYNKDLKKYYNANKEQLKIIADEALLWDGHSGYRSYYSSTNKNNVDVIQFAFSAIGIRTGISKSDYSDKGWNNIFVATPTKNTIVGYTGEVEMVKSIDGKKYCFVTDTGFFAARRNGKIFMTGNCGMLTVKLTDTEIDFEKLDKVINEKIPHGFNVHTRKMGSMDGHLTKIKCRKHVDLKRARLSLGSLGGGNHFIEVSKDDLGSYYLIIHSGSRKLGGDVCKYYQNLAFQNVNEMKKVKENLIQRLKAEGREKDINSELKKLKKPSANKELACLSGEDFDNYMFDMDIVQKFAVANRATMANIIINNMKWTEDSRFETIHNYIDFKRMILRKGAVSAEEGETLLIPINMRDGSLLCVGKGNEDWNYSAPHGAGRLMSRRKAKDTLSINEFTAQMKDIYSTSVNESTLDEAPYAYKPIDEILETIQDTVTVKAILKPVYNFKSH